jgi:hypothetical protein
MLKGIKPIFGKIWDIMEKMGKLWRENGKSIRIKK